MKKINVKNKITVALLFVFAISLSNIIAQTDTMYVMKAGVVVCKYNVSTEVDSVIFYQPSTSNSTTVTDIDGNVYNIVTIGTQTWMAENLRVTHYADGTSIPLVTDASEWADLGNTDADTAKAYCWYNNDSTSYFQTYGAIYTYAAATNGTPYKDTNVQGVCPDGWHLPRDAEWQTLLKYVSEDGYNDSDGSAGTALKATSGWNNDGNGTDDYGFAALPGGYRPSKGTFSNAGDYSYLWSSTEYSSGRANRLSLHNSGVIVISYVYKSYGLSVRCVRDSE